MSNRIIEEISSDLDPILAQLADGTDAVSDAIEVNENHAMLVLGVKYNDENHADGEGVETYINAMGYFGILEEGLYAEIKDQVENGSMGLFITLRNVIRDLEEQFGISPEDKLDDTANDGEHLH